MPAMPAIPAMPAMPAMPRLSTAPPAREARLIWRRPSLVARRSWQGVWEFISSEEACSLIAGHKNATEACSALVIEAAARWKRYEGSYRDDITAIVAFLPFLESGWAEEEDVEDEEDEAEDADAEKSRVFLNSGQAGLSYKGADGGEAGAAGRRADGQGDEGEEGEEEEGSGAENSEFAARRLSVHNPYDDDWNEVGEGEGGGGGDDDDDNEPPPSSSPTVPLTSSVDRI